MSENTNPETDPESTEVDLEEVSGGQELPPAYGDAEIPPQPPVGWDGF
jgi:hypothetical protein